MCEHDQNVYGLAAQLDEDSTLAQFAARGVQIEGAEANPREERAKEAMEKSSAERKSSGL
jgi:hypothetical protein